MDVNTLGNQFLLNALTVAALQWFKNSKWFPWITLETEKLNRVLAVVIAGLTSLGVHTSFTAGVLTVTGLTWATIGTGLYNWLYSFVMQQVVFKATASTPASTQTQSTPPIDSHKLAK